MKIAPRVKVPRRRVTDYEKIFKKKMCESSQISTYSIFSYFVVDKYNTFYPFSTSLGTNVFRIDSYLVWIILIIIIIVIMIKTRSDSTRSFVQHIRLCVFVICFITHM